MTQTSTTATQSVLADRCLLAQDVARELGVSSSTARRRLEELVAEGKATRSTGTVHRHGRWVPAVYYTEA